MLAGLSLVWVDAQVREGWPYIPTAQHWRWALLLYAAVGGALGALAHLALAAEARWSGRQPLPLRALFFVVLGSAPLASVAVWAFTGEAVGATRWGTFGPALLFLLGAGGIWCSAWIALWAARAAERGQRSQVAAVALASGALGLQIAHLDLTSYVALYGRLHAALEAAAWASLGLGFSLLLRLALSAAPALERASVALGSAALLAAAGLALSAGLRTGVEGALRHVFLEDVYVGRMLRRLQLVEAFATDPRGFRSLPLSRLEALRRRYGLLQLTEDAVWRAPPTAPSASVQGELWRLRDPLRRYNVLVYYVDTLRADVAADRKTMPNVAAFADGAVRFPRAYSASSDTLRALPALTGGDYDILTTPKNDVLRMARRAGYASTLVIPKSAQYFLSKLRPEFRFDRTLAIADHPERQEVWGYGADRPTSGQIVDRTLELLDAPRRKGQPFLYWLFNFDLHNWRELSREHVEAAQARFDVHDEPEALPYRYRAVAAAVDHEFGRLVEGLERRKLLEDTVILFVSDHGEALGRDGFWVHSVFLWETLVRVPLILKAPGLAPREVSERVSLVDVAPTLARYMTPNPDMAGYAGEDLLLRLTEPSAPRRLPILLVSASKDVLVRVGVMAPGRDYKLVLPLEVGLPELYDLNAADSDANNLAERHPQLTERLLRDVVASPVFPRSLWDFDVRDTKEQRAAAGIPVF